MSRLIWIALVGVALGAAPGCPAPGREAIPAPEAAGPAQKATDPDPVEEHRGKVLLLTFFSFG